MKRPPCPTIVPVFPLTGSLLLPGNYLPLNVFEPRYRRLVTDVGEGGYFGMIQPLIPGLDNWGVPRDPPVPDLYRAGCIGRVDRLEPQGPRRFLILLKGVIRFRVVRELPLEKGYRKVEADYRDFLGDLAKPEPVVDSTRLLHAVQLFARLHHLDFDNDVLEALSGLQLLNALCAALPLAPAEKQLLLETQDALAREQTLLDLMGMDLDPGTGRPPSVGHVVN
jgi:Lon protease-like protein